MMLNAIRPVILSGGAGTRLWPLSRSDTPKQLLDLFGTGTLLQSAAARTAGVPGFAAPMVVAAADHRFQIAEQLRELGLVQPTIALEPCARDTGPAIFAAAAIAAAEDVDVLLLVMPADHAIGDNDRFFAAVRSGQQAARAGRIVLFGVRPTYAATGYGYVTANEPAEGEAWTVARFHEKPGRADAESLIAAGALWNSGVFLMSARTVLEEAERLEPTALASVRAAVAASRRDLDFLRLGETEFALAASMSFDRAILERTTRAAVISATFPWADVGAWSAVHALSRADENGNVLHGKVIAQHTRNAYLRSEGPALAVLGLENVIVVAAQDAVLVAAKDRDQEVRAVVDDLRAGGLREATEGVRVHRPWGWFQKIDNGGRFQVKRIAVAPGRALSLQRHQHRSEHWVVVEGEAEVTVGADVRAVRANESVYVPAGVTHRLRNTGTGFLYLIEVQTGHYLGEDDIERLQDDYARF